MKPERHFVVVGKRRTHDEERWKQFLMALAYARYEQRVRPAAETEADEQATPDGGWPEDHQ
jgi:hypothetical protein